MSQYVSIFIAVLVLILCGLMYFGYRQINKIQMENNQIKYDMEALKKIQRDMDSHYKMAIDMAISQHLTNNQKVNSRKEEEEFADEEDDYETEDFVEEEEISAQEESDDGSEEEVQEDSEEEVDEEILNALEESVNNEDQEEETESVEQNEESENQEELESQEEQNVEELEEETNNEEEETNNEEKTEEDRLVETVNKIQEQIESRNRRKGSAPATPAKEYQEGTVLENEGKKYVVSANKNGSKRWKLLQ